MITLNAHSHSISTSEITTYGVCWVRVCVNAMIGRATPGKRGYPGGPIPRSDPRQKNSWRAAQNIQVQLLT